MADASEYAVFDTAIGHCAVAYTRRGIAVVGLPDGSRAALGARFDRFADRADGPLPSDVDAAIDAIVAHLRGDVRDLAQIRVDLERASAFDRRVYELTRRIPPGQTREYGALAAELGGAGLSRAVGQSLGRNPVPLLVPCHRVIRAGGGVGGFSAVGGAALKRRLLAIEGAWGPQLGMEFD